MEKYIFLNLGVSNSITLEIKTHKLYYLFMEKEHLKLH